ncbi:hypothetical protein BV22DRAFT_986658, partial [Leucogyrophana mollusca]
SGGVLYELESDTTAKWLNEKDTRKQFIDHFGPGTVIKDRTLQVIVQNVPTTFTPDSQLALKETETKSGLVEGSIAKARWIKPIQRRAQNQRTAHAIFALTSRDAANQVIRQGMVVEGRKVQARKLMPEPTRCLKCHSLKGDHFAAQCPEDHDTCGTCGNEHRTSECDNQDPTNRFCVNCKEDGHAAWDRMCPTFLEATRKHHARTAETKYRYFPTADPATW